MKKCCTIDIVGHSHTQWDTHTLSGTLKHTVRHSHTQWDNHTLSGTLSHTMGHSDTQWNTHTLSGTLTHTVGHSHTQWDTHALSGTHTQFFSRNGQVTYCHDKSVLCSEVSWFITQSEFCNFSGIPEHLITNTVTVSNWLQTLSCPCFPFYYTQPSNTLPGQADTGNLLWCFRFDPSVNGICGTESGLKRDFSPNTSTVLSFHHFTTLTLLLMSPTLDNP
jgi:hypothetical protein